MLLLIVLMVAMIAVVVSYFWQLSPRGVNRAKLLGATMIVVAVAAGVARLAGYILYRGGAQQVEKKDMLAYLAIMAGGMAFLLVVLVGGVIRNLLVFPRSRRAPDVPGER